MSSPCPGFSGSSPGLCWDRASSSPFRSKRAAWGTVIEIQHHCSHVYGRTCRRGHPSPADTTAHAVAIPLLLLVYSDLVAKEEIRIVALRLSKTLGRKLRIDGLFDLCIHDLVGMCAALDHHPLIGVIFRRVFPAAPRCCNGAVATSLPLARPRAYFRRPGA